MSEKEFTAAEPIRKDQAVFIRDGLASPLLEKPLHVRIAEALGWSALRILPTTDHWIGNSPATGHGKIRYPFTGSVPFYDLDWSATGPLIEKYGIGLEKNTRTHRWTAWFTRTNETDEEAISDSCDTPLIAACNLILALKEAGKL
jgi:hypothetical protein